jgi:prepilin-type N-terminal cleavage/methylation domain-containing protein
VKVLMLSQKQSGFTLIEISLVMAITGFLIIIAFTGQDQIRAQTQFDSAINQLVSTVNQAKTEATAGLNLTDNGPNAGQGTNGGSCPGGNPANPYVFAGSVWSADSGSIGGLAVVTINYFKAETNPVTKDLDGISCQFASTNVSIPYDNNISVQNTAGTIAGGRIIFARDNGGLVHVCQVATVGGYPGSVETTFGDPTSATCTQPAPMVLDFNDAAGHKAQISIDDSGLARRLN